jgi:hypothetical protein
MVRPYHALAGALLLAGCTVEIPGVELGGGDSGAAGTSASSDPVGGKLSSNGLALDQSALALLDPAPLGRWQSATEAVADSGSLDALLAHPAGAEHLEYIARCALDDGQTLSAGGASYPGLYGLATAWVDAGCDESCQKWLSACVLAHANGYGIEVTISLRGAHRGLAWDQAIAQEFTLQEAAFYGNVFQVASSELPPLYACSGRALIAWDEDPEHHESSLDYLQRRICGTGGPCGLDYSGPCVYPPVMQASTCARDAGWEDYYGDCEGESYETYDPQQIPVYSEVITTYLVDEP